MSNDGLNLSDHTNTINSLTDHLFRHASGKMVSVLTKIFGPENLETAEDVVQQTFIDAMQVWRLKGIPDNPSGWLYRVARNKAIDIIRRNKHSVQYDFSDNERTLLTSEYTLAGTMEHFWQEELVKDDLLRMMFTCCHPSISEDNQVTLILKTLCGFSTMEIARAFLVEEETVTKRLYRTKEFFRQNRIKMEIPSVNELKVRTNAVLHSIYLLFNEGYNSTASSELIRQDLIGDAMMLCKLLAENKHTQLPETYALMALICFHSARSQSRLTPNGEIILLDQQDRTKWDFGLIQQGVELMDKASFGNSVSTYHIEAAIAFEHCTAPSFAETNWGNILKLYEWLCVISPSPVSELNKCVAIMQVHGPQRALDALKAISDTKQLLSFHLYHSLLGELYSRLHLTSEAVRAFSKARELTRSAQEQKLLDQKIACLLDS